MAHDDTPAEARSTSVTVGGEVDEVRVTLALYGDELDPAEVSQLLERISKIPLLRPPIHPVPPARAPSAVLQYRCGPRHTDGTGGSTASRRGIYEMRSGLSAHGRPPAR